MKKIKVEFGDMYPIYKYSLFAYNMFGEETEVNLFVKSYLFSIISSRDRKDLRDKMIKVVRYNIAKSGSKGEIVWQKGEDWNKLIEEMIKEGKK